MVQFGVLGPVRVVPGGGGQEIAISAPRLRTLLAMLLWQANEPVSVDRLAEVVWEGAQPADAAGAIRALVMRLRRVLGPPAAARVATRAPGYAIEISADELDASWFEHLGRAAGVAVLAERWPDAARMAEEALGLWRGAPLADISSQLLRDQWVPRLEQLRAQALEWRFEASLHLGRHEELIPELRDMVGQYPLRERFHAQLMLALCQSSRQAEALESYRDARRVLVEELGVEPGPELRQLHERVLAGDTTLLAPRQTMPSAHEAGSGLGVPTADSLWRPLYQLPAAPADFTGRQAECESMLGALLREDAVPLVAISGQPGIGKTALALQVAHQARGQFPDGQVWVQLAGASARPRDPGEVLGELLRAFGVPGSAVPDDQAERALVFRSKIAGRRLLVVADDAASAEQVTPLLPGTPGCALLVTSRMSLEGLAGARIMPLEVMTRQEAVGLLSRILGPARAEADPAGLGELAEVCGELPLALRIAGARLAARPAWPIAAMTRRLARLHGRLRELEAGNLSVRAGIEASYSLLSERHQRAFRFLCLPGPSDFAEWVVPVLLGEPDSAGVLDALLSRSLVTPTGVDVTGEPRYRLHDLLRDYAAERLADEPAAGKQAAAGRLLQAYLQLARQADAKLPPEPYFLPPTFTPRPAVLPAELAGELTADPIAWFTSERQNLLAAVDQALIADQPGLARELAQAQCAYQHLQDRHDDKEQLWSLIAGRVSPHDVYPQLRIGACLVDRGRAAEVLPVLDACVSQALDAEVLAIALYWRGTSAIDLDDFDRARDDARQGVAAARRAGSPLAELLNLRTLSHGLSLAGRHAEAVRVAESATAIAADLGVATYKMAALHTLAFSCALAGQYDRSIQLCHQRIELSLELGDVRAQGLCYGVLGDAYSGQGQWELAIQSLQRALPFFETHRALRNYGLCLYKLAGAYEGLGRYPEATGYLERALQVFRQLQLPAKAGQVQQALDRCQAHAVC